MILDQEKHTQNFLLTCRALDTGSFNFHVIKNFFKSFCYEISYSKQ